MFNILLLLFVVVGGCVVQDEADDGAPTTQASTLAEEETLVFAESPQPTQQPPLTAERTIGIAAPVFHGTGSVLDTWVVSSAGYYGYMDAADNEARDVLAGVNGIVKGDSVSGATLNVYRDGGECTLGLYQMTPEGAVLAGEIEITEGREYVSGYTRLTHTADPSFGYFLRLRVKNGGTARALKVLSAQVHLN